jgi:hypothetical protein
MFGSQERLSRHAHGVVKIDAAAAGNRDQGGRIACGDFSCGMRPCGLYFLKEFTREPGENFLSRENGLFYAAFP